MNKLITVVSLSLCMFVGGVSAEVNPSGFGPKNTTEYTSVERRSSETTQSHSQFGPINSQVVENHNEFQNYSGFGPHAEQ